MIRYGIRQVLLAIPQLQGRRRELALPAPWVWALTCLLMPFPVPDPPRRKQAVTISARGDRGACSRRDPSPPTLICCGFRSAGARFLVTVPAARSGSETLPRQILRQQARPAGVAETDEAGLYAISRELLGSLATEPGLHSHPLPIPRWAMCGNQIAALKTPAGAQR